MQANASDSNPGSELSPFLTIQRAANVMVAGDVCVVHEGVYCETIRPANSGTAANSIEFRAQAGEQVNVSGADLITGWQLHAGNIYRTRLGWVFDKKQVFTDGGMINEARWPNTGHDLLRPNLAYAEEGSTTSFTHSGLTQPAGTWNSQSRVHLWAAQPVARTVTYTRAITSYDPATHRITFADADGLAGKDSPFYLVGSLGALDVPNEWFYNSATGDLYLMAPAGNHPAQHVVEAKRRDYAFDLSARQYVNVRGFRIFAASVRLTGSYCTLSDCQVKYVSHFTDCNGYATPWGDTGLSVSGHHNTVDRCLINWSAGNGISLDGLGQSNTVSNCRILNVNYMACDMAAITVQGPNHIVIGNTCYNSGRHLILLRGLELGAVSGVSVVYNNLFNPSLLTVDDGCIYTNGTDGTGSVLAYNWCHGNRAEWFGVGIYLDNNCHHWLVHHNASWGNSDAGLRVNVPSTYNSIYNNTFHGNDVRSITFWGPTAEKDMTGSIYMNLIAARPLALGTGVTQSNNYYWWAPNDPKFVDAGAGDFRLREDTPCEDTGIVLPGTEGYQGAAPEPGAYELGGPAWEAGANWEGWRNPGRPALLNILWRVAVNAGSERFTTSRAAERDSGTCEGQVYYAASVFRTGTRPLYRLRDGSDGRDAISVVNYPFDALSGHVWSARDDASGRAPLITGQNSISGDRALLSPHETLSGYQTANISGAYAYPRYLNATTSLLSVTQGDLAINSNAICGGSVWQWTWKGMQYLNTYDYTRGIQCGLSWTDEETGLRHEVLEGGDRFSESPLPAAQRHGAPLAELANSQPGTQVSASIPLERYPEEFGGDADHPVLWPELRLGKRLTLNYGGMPNVAAYTARLFTPNDLYAGIRPVSISLRQNFNRYWTYDAQSKDMREVFPAANADRMAPVGFSTDYGGVIISTADMTSALGLYAVNLTKGGAVDGFNLYNLTDGTPGVGQFIAGCTMIEAFRQDRHLPAGWTEYPTWIITGSLDQVAQAMRALNPGSYNNVSSFALFE